MKITKIESLRTEEFADVLLVRVHTDSGLIGLGETQRSGLGTELQPSLFERSDLTVRWSVT